jgi:hypothetical protein
MKTPRSKSARCAFTLMELLALIMILALLLFMILPMIDRRIGDRDPNVHCMINQRQIGIGMIMWSEDHSRAFPPHVSKTNEGTSEVFSSAGASVHFGALSNYLSKSCNVLVCPTDKKKLAATNFSLLTDRNVSYFFNLDTAPGLTNSFMLGDRHLAIDHKSVPPGLFTVSANMAMGWTTELHHRGSSRPAGVMEFVDGHAEVVRSDLQRVLQRQTVRTNRLAVP